MAPPGVWLPEHGKDDASIRLCGAVCAALGSVLLPDMRKNCAMPVVRGAMQESSTTQTRVAWRGEGWRRFGNVATDLFGSPVSLRSMASLFAVTAAGVLLA